MHRADPWKRLVRKDCRKAMWPAVVGYTAGDLLGSLLNIYTAGILGSFADAVLRLDLSGGMRQFWILLLCLLINLALVPLISMAGELNMFSNALRHDRVCLGRFLDKTYESASKIEAGEAQYRLEDDAISLRCDWVTLAENMVLIPVTLVVLLYRSFTISILFSLLTLGVCMLKLVVPVATKRTLAKYKLEEKAYKTKLRSMEMEIAGQPHMVKMYGLGKAVPERQNRLFSDYFQKVVRKNSRYKTIADKILAFLDTFCVLLILFVGALLVSRGKISAGAVAVMAGYFGIYNSMIAKLTEVIRMIPDYQNDVDRVAILYSDAEIKEGESVDTFDSISVQQLGFCYGTEPVLQNLSFSVRKGDKLAVIGPNGSGKSTLIFILCGLLGSYKGSVRMNGRELKQIEPGQWRRQFALVQQDPFLFEGSVRENISIGNLQAKEEEISAVMERLGIAHLADRSVSFQDKSLSGGEKQRISLARALLKHPRLLIFDEPGNHLDAAAVQWMADFIRQCKETVIFISHDKTLQQASGQVLQIGTDADA